MKKLQSFLIIMILLACQHPVLGQSRKMRFGVEPVYNHLFYRWDFQDLEKVSRNLFGIGLITEKSISKSNEQWKLGIGLYYFYLHSYTLDKIARGYLNCDQILVPVVNNYINLEEDFRSHNLRLPVNLVYTVKKFRISGGLLFDYEIKNRYQVDARLYPEGSCADDPEYGSLSQGERYTGQLENNKFSLGFEFGIGYSFKLSQKFTIVPNLNYNVIFVKEKSQATSDWYLDKQHGIGVGCKVFFKTKKPS